MAEQDTLLAILLRQVRKHGTTEPLRRAGLHYTQIVSLIDRARASGLIAGDTLALAPQGEQWLKEYDRRSRSSRAEEWIQAAEEYRVTPLDPAAVFIPKMAPPSPLPDAAK